MARTVVCIIGTLLAAAVLFSPISCRRLQEANRRIIPASELGAF